MITKILDNLIAQALQEFWVIKYVALSPDYMRKLVDEVTSFAGKEFKVDSLSMYKDVPVKVKEIVGFQVAYEIDQNAPQGTHL
jgi:hypothetical protein